MSDGAPVQKKPKLGGNWMESEFELDPFVFTYGSDSDDDLDKSCHTNNDELSVSDEVSNNGYEASSEDEDSCINVAQKVPDNLTSTSSPPKKLVMPGPHNNYEFEPLPDWFYEDGPAPAGVLDDVFPPANGGHSNLFSDSDQTDGGTGETSESCDATLYESDTDKHSTGASATSEYQESSSPSESSSFASSSDDDLNEYANFGDKYYDCFHVFNRRH